MKPGRFGSFFVLCFLALGGHCLQMLCLPGFGTHANTQNLPHFRAFPASIQEHSPPKCLFFVANAKLPNRPAFALLQVHRLQRYWPLKGRISGPSGRLQFSAAACSNVHMKNKTCRRHMSAGDCHVPLFGDPIYPERRKLTN